MFNALASGSKSNFARIFATFSLVVSLLSFSSPSPVAADATGSTYYPPSSYTTMSPGIVFGTQTTPFTIEAWFKTDYPDTSGQAIAILGSAPNPTGYKGLSFISVPGNFNQWRLDCDGFASVQFDFAQTPDQNSWHFIVASRDSAGFMQVWIDGVASTTGRAASPDFTGPTTRVGAWTNNARYNDGTYISNLRVTNTNRFATTLSSISIPTSPFSIVPGTQLLMNAEGFADASGNQEFATSGSAIVSSQNPFFGVATISNVSPSSGPSQGGTAVTISGTNLLDVSSVTIGGIAATIVNTSATSIEILTPSGSVGSQTVVVTGAAGSPTSAFSYELVDFPQAPTQVTATSNGAGTSIVSWTAPASNGGSEITEYQILSSGGQFCVSSSMTCLMTGLSHGRAYTFTVRAKNILGYGPYSLASASITTASERDANLANTGATLNSNLFATTMAVLLISLGAAIPFIRKKRIRRH